VAHAILRGDWSAPMKLSNKGRYGLRAIFDIAFHNQGRATQIREIAERQDIPARFLEQIFQDLKRAGLVSSKRGPRGGYQLSKAPAEIRVGDILRALEGSIELRGDDAVKTGDETSRVITNDVLDEIAQRMEAAWNDFTIEALCERGEALGQRHHPAGRYVYVI
jgi:Rrf2 family protein